MAAPEPIKTYNLGALKRKDSVQSNRSQLKSPTQLTNAGSCSTNMRSLTRADGQILVRGASPGLAFEPRRKDQAPVEKFSKNNIRTRIASRSPESKIGAGALNSNVSKQQNKFTPVNPLFRLPKPVDQDENSCIANSKNIMEEYRKMQKQLEE